eukprot:7381316-Prymnesium_polylepis.1
MDRLARLRRELTDEKECAKNESLTQSTRKDCRENAELVRGMIDEASSRVIMERSMTEITVVDKAPDAKPDAVVETPYLIPGELIWQMEAWSEILEDSKRGILD